MNYIQYIDDTYAVKVKEISYYDEQGYGVKDIQTPFFILSVFMDNKRVNGVSFANYDSLPMLSIINDLGNVDLNVIPENYFATAFTEIFLRVPFATGSGVEISNFTDFQKKPLRYLKEYKLPQFRLDGRFSQGSGYAYDSRVYSLLKLGTIQSDNKFYTAFYDTYRNGTHIDTLEFQGENPNYIANGYDLVTSFPVQNNGDIVQFGDFYVKMTTTTTYPYGLSVFIFTDIRTNEFWFYVNYIESGTSIIKKGEFDMSTFVCVNGGFKIKNLLHQVEIQITNIYG
ncbi:hypothetical protein KHA90_06390 [Flavobacterium psychroterrae]|uniref:DUF4249 domain-containing protein n=1 Tax=Flavobacterium psychroterrae TaxID=2133767 RepID=A0ABS5PA69_9FLAO|nr:hypothetical protein [Flavobacterium psychroterrae]MBS7230646.1 hypothetical protein [Flavobacterium psychroterrae]